MKFFIHKELFFMFVLRDFKTMYKQTILGPLWVIINPLVTSFVFIIVFNKIGNISTGDIPSFLFYFLGISLWNFLQANIIQISNFYNANNGLFAKVYFPRLVIPFSYLLNNLFKFFIHCFIFFLFCFFIFNLKLDINFNSILIILYVLTYVVLFSFFLGILINAFSFIIKDFSYIITYVLNVLLFLTPVFFLKNRTIRWCSYFSN